jgi:hypothetical protein
MQIKRPYITRLKINAFSYNIRAIYSYSDVNIKLKNLAIEKRSLFLALVNLYRFLKDYSLSATPSILSLFKIKPVFISTKIILKQGLKQQIEDISR